VFSGTHYGMPTAVLLTTIWHSHPTECAQKKNQALLRMLFPYPSKHASFSSLWSNQFSQSVSEIAHKVPSQTMCLGIQSQDEVTACLIQQYCLSQDCALHSRVYRWLLHSNVSCSTARIPAMKILTKSVFRTNSDSPQEK
jgi:hypothetical protein